MPTMGYFPMLEFYKYMKDEPNLIMIQLDTIFMVVNMLIGHGHCR